MKKIRQLRQGIRMVKMVVGAALTLAAANTQAVPFALSPDGNAVVRIIPESAAAPLDASLITAAYPGWTVSNAPLPSPGAFTSSTYTAGWSGSTGGAQFTGNYSQIIPVPSGSQLHYIQIINTNLPLGGTSSPYIDPRPNDDTLPFYWTTSEVASRSTSTSVSFSDFSKRAASSLATTNPITWTAQLYPVTYDGATTVSVQPGVQWGWTMKPATVGSASATFVMPSPSCPPAVCTGIGTNSITWGTGTPGSLSFTGSPFAPKVGDPFKLGTLSYGNGTTFGGEIGSIDLDISLAFDNVSEANFVFHTGLSINNTPNTSDPIASADFVAFTSGGFPYTFNVLEGASASADLMAKLTPILSVIPVTGILGALDDKDPFTTPDAIAVLGFNLELVALVNPSSGGFVAGVPAPGTISLLLLGLIGIGLSLPRSRYG